MWCMETYTAFENVVMAEILGARIQGRGRGQKEIKNMNPQTSTDGKQAYKTS